MSVLITDIQNFCVEILNASQPSSGYGVINSERFKAGEFDFAIRLGDIAAARSILNNPNDGRRAGFLTSSAVLHTNFIPTHVGPIDDVWFDISGGYYAGLRGVEPWPISRLNELEIENRNPQANPFIEPHVIIEGDAVFHNAAGLVAGGASAASLFVRYPVLNYNGTSTTIQSPDEFVRAIACAALAILMMKDGQRTGAGQTFESMYRNEMAVLGVQTPPPLEAATDAQAG